tara:strand:- start:951 stop:1076 length:126 start_codon:yes stop_codon:yes gene_type:complete
MAIEMASGHIAWGAAILLSLIAAVLNWPIIERSLEQRRAAA